MSDPFMLVGLGNPGSQYENNRHNIGFMAVDEIVRRHRFSAWRKKFDGLICDTVIDDAKIYALKPQTFMNLSGNAVQAMAAFYKIRPENIIVFYDELDLAPGKLRVKQGGGANGHNGLKSIDAHLGKNYWRVRMGIGRPEDKERVTGYVLGNFAKGDALWLDKLLPVIAEEFPLLLQKKDGMFMTNIARAMQPEKPKPKPASTPEKPPQEKTEEGQNG